VPLVNATPLIAGHRGPGDSSPESPLGTTVAVGTTIADRPPHRSVRAPLRIRLLPGMPSGKAGHGVRVQNAGAWNPTVQQRGETSPSHLSALAAADQNAPPQPTNAPGKGAQLSRVARNSMVLVVAQHSLAKPCTDVGCAMMLPALKLGLKGFELRDHPLLRRDPPDDERSVALALPTEVSETQECEGLWFSLSALLPVTSGKPG